MHERTESDLNPGRLNLVVVWYWDIKWISKFGHIVSLSYPSSCRTATLISVQLTCTRVLGNAKSGVFLRQLLVLYVYIFLLGILIYASFFLLTLLKLLKNTRRRQRESKFGFHHKRSEDYR